MEQALAAAPFGVLEGVRCLECGAVYSKPAVGGTVETNPGCPVCGYVGWIPVRLPVELRGPRRSAGCRPPHQPARPR